MKVAVIDVGYNSLKMVKYRVEPDGSVRSYGQLGVMARLGEGLEKTGFLGQEQVLRTVGAIKACRQAASEASISRVMLVGTSPVREAANREAFLSLVERETGLAMRVLTGNEEALYGFMGAAPSVGAEDAAYFDLGGGSLQLTYAEGLRVRRMMSLPLGALKLTDLFADDGGFTRKGRSRLVEQATKLIPSRREMRVSRDAVLVGTGGVLRAMARLEQERIGYPLNKIHNYRLSADAVDRMSRDFLRLDRRELAEIDAIGKDRAGTVVAGSLVIRVLMKRLGFEWITVSTHGLRDGILAEYLSGLAPRAISAGTHGAKGKRRRVGGTEVVDCLARHGFFTQRQLATMGAAVGLGRSEAVGEANADALFGIVMSEDLPMAHRDQLLMALAMVRARRSRTANWYYRRHAAVLPEDGMKSVRRMGAALRLLDVLDRASARVRATYRGGLRIRVLECEGEFPLELARAASASLSASIKKPITITLAGRPRLPEEARAKP